MINIFRLSLLGLVLLVCRPDATEVSAWVPILRNNVLPAVVAPHRHLSTTVYSTIEDSTETLTETSSATAIEREKIAIPVPKIQYTVPGMKRGWKENGVWMDEDGPRNGPPQNFWRQMGDERLYNDNIDLIQDLLKLNSFEGKIIEKTSSEQQDNRLLQNDILNGMVERLERTNSIRIPTLNRLILGDWAPVVRGGKVVATSTAGEEKSVDFPYRFHVQRSAGQKLAPKTHYGTFDEHLEPGEEITVQELSDSNSVTSGVLEVSSDKQENKLVEGYSNANDGNLYFGGITYVTKYIMIMRQQAQQQDTAKDEENVAKGPITEIWMRVDSK